MGIVKTVGAVIGTMVLAAGAGLLLFIKELGRFADEMDPYNEDCDNDSGEKMGEGKDHGD